MPIAAAMVLVTVPHAGNFCIVVRDVHIPGAECRSSFLPGAEIKDKHMPGSEQSDCCS